MPDTTAARPDVIDILARLDIEEKSEKTLLGQISQPPKRFYLTTLLVIVWAVLLLAVSPMLAVLLPDPLTWLNGKWDGTGAVPYVLSGEAFIFYSFQIPAVVLVAATMGQRYGTVAILLYLIAGFVGLPFFANGGGTHYFSELSAGYLIGYLLVPSALEKSLKRAYYKTEWFRGRSIWMLIGALIAVAIIHGFGIAGIAINAITGNILWVEAGEWIVQLSWPVLIYDLCFSSIAVMLVRIFRLFFWFCLY